MKLIQVLKLLGSNHVKSLKTNAGKCHRTYLSLQGFDLEQTNHILQFHFLKEYQNNLQQLIGHFNQKYEDKAFIRDHLFFCKKCIRTGYHSVFHQFTLLYHCPFHMIPLENYCPHCKHLIPYECSDQLLTSPFQCKCGYMFLKKRRRERFFQHWGKEEELVCKNVLKWLSLNENQKTYISNLHIFPTKFSEKTSLLDGILQSVSVKSEYLQPYKKVQSTRNIRLIKTTEKKIKNNQCRTQKSQEYLNDKLEIEFQEDLYNSYCKTISSISRKLRNTILKKHKTCIHRFYGGNETEQQCPYAFAYLHWSAIVRRYMSPSFVDSKFGRIEPANHNFVDFPFYYDNTFYESLFWQWAFKSKNIIIDENMDAIKWVFGRCLAHAAIAFFNEWIHQTEINPEYLKKFKGIWRGVFNYDCVPDYFLHIDFEGNHAPEFYFHEIPKIYLENTSCKCPFTSVKSRREPYRKKRFEELRGIYQRK
ncbi:hypothetical protein EEL32_20340 [Brevibacillus laterosporus]|nr:hypothetical protein [Brevibacillus laterosporus]TPG81256.1 hypothetical protein EEL32_20340 [Brevibacillus laterosporus]